MLLTMPGEPPSCARVSVSLDGLCPEVIDIILSALPTSALRHVRLVNRHLGTLATKWTFQHLRLGARNLPCDYAYFTAVAQSKSLRPFVREVTCDTWPGSAPEGDGDFAFALPHQFLNALPLLSSFRNLTSVHLRFSQRTKHVYTNGSDTETDDFRYRVLDTVFQCIAGSWSAEQQELMDEKLLGLDFEANYKTAPPNVLNLGPIPVRELSISNLADFDDKRFTDSEAFKTVISSTSLADLRLCITQQQVEDDHGGEQQPESALWFREKYDMFENLPRTWLSPSIAGNLRVLSLYSRDYWGWNPRMDFRAVRPGNGPDSGFPQLKVLALGKYVFSHEWQFDWIASLGQLSASGGLEELYLDQCPIMVQARHQAPADYGTRVVGKDADGNDVTVSNEGYYRIEGMAEEDTYDFDITEEDFPMRWHQVLGRWRKTMKALKVFRMGHSAWNFAPQQTVDAWRAENPSRHTDQVELKSRLHHNNFRNFNRPSPPPLRLNHNANMAKYRLGTGVDQNQKFQARYVYFDINGGPSEWRDVYWPSSAYPRQPQLEPKVREKDMTEVSLMMATTDARL